MTTITMEERSAIRAEAAQRGPIYLALASLRLLDALEAAEANATYNAKSALEKADAAEDMRALVANLRQRAEKAEAERDVLAKRVADYGTGPCPNGSIGYCAMAQSDMSTGKENSRCIKCWLEWAAAEVQRKEEKA